MSAAPRSRHEERLEDRRKQIAACLEGLIYGDDVNLDTPIHSRIPRPPAARHLAPTKRQREAQALGTPPHSAETRPTCKGRCSARPIAAGGATSGDSQPPLGDALPLEDAADSRAAHNDWQDYWQLLGPHSELGNSSADAASAGQPTASHSLGGQPCNLPFAQPTPPSAQLEQVLTPMAWDLFTRFDLSTPEATPPPASAPIPPLLPPRGSELAYVATPFVEFDYPSYEDNMELEGTETAQNRPSTPSPSPSSGTPPPPPSPRRRSNAPASPRRKQAAGDSRKGASAAAAHAAPRPRLHHRPHASVEKRYRAGINEKIEALRQCLEMRKRPKHAKLHEDLMAACTAHSPFSSAPSEDGNQGLAHAAGTGDNTAGTGTSPSGGPDGSTAVPPSARMNKASVLIEACDYIQQLEDENGVMMEQLRGCVSRLRTTRQALLLLTLPPSAFPSSPLPPWQDGRGIAGGS